MDDVELRLDLVAAHVVHGGDVLVEDQVFGGGWKPEKKQLCLERDAQNCSKPQYGRKNF